MWEEGKGWGFYNGGGSDPASGVTRGDLFLYTNEEESPHPKETGWKGSEAAKEWDGAKVPSLTYVKK